MDYQGNHNLQFSLRSNFESFEKIKINQGILEFRLLSIHHATRQPFLCYSQQRRDNRENTTVSPHRRRGAWVRH